VDGRDKPGHDDWCSKARSAKAYKSQIVPQARAGLPLDSALLASLDDHAEIDPLRVRFEMTVLIGS
jgi:hypothetical protein